MAAPVSELFGGRELVRQSKRGSFRPRPCAAGRLAAVSLCSSLVAGEASMRSYGPGRMGRRDCGAVTAGGAVRVAGVGIWLRGGVPSARCIAAVCTAAVVVFVYRGRIVTRSGVRLKTNPAWVPF